MRKRFSSTASQAAHTGLSPGRLAFVGQKRTEEVKLSLFQYGPSSDGEVKEQQALEVAELLPFKEKPGVTWLNIDGSHDVEVIEEVGSHVNVHSLVLEDILDTNQRPKVESYDEYLYIVLKMLYWDEEHEEIDIEQVSLILTDTLVITFQEGGRDVFDPVRERIREDRGRIRKMGADYLAYALLDAIVDHYFIVLENLGEQIEFLEEEVVTQVTNRTLQEIHQLKGEMIFLRKSVWPLREVIGHLERGETTLFKESTLVYLRDLYDHTIQVIEAVETYRDVVSGTLDIYLSSVSNRLNEVMKILTIISTIFIPLTFITGLYGMNFRHMPELQWRWGYYLVLFIMVVTVVIMLIYFRRKKWI